MEAKLADNEVENVELGPIGNILASSDYCILSSVRVIQQQQNADGNETNVSKTISDETIHARIAEESYE
ncbi:hypothetical protein Patl1_31905 [Pistacia atlantica]|uniref:Uncharacterized protein n=1 Tax=Pistacia atlantica TaxID=434234 RepID=A0ACC1ANL9_9ROSI|nr:hypothetical protein Patl1_31905 [Pistacia atlantica]